MKFLCVPCDRPMKLVQTSPPDRGSISVLYHCSQCDHEMAMLTNPHETQVVTSMGVKIGPGDGGAAAAGATAPGEPGQAAATGAAAEDESGGCPFAEMIPGLSAAADGEPESPAMAWTPEASRRLERIPSFVRPMARVGIEKYARDNGFSTVSETVLDRAREFFDM